MADSFLKALLTNSVPVQSKVPGCACGRVVAWHTGVLLEVITYLRNTMLGKKDYKTKYEAES